MTRMQHQFWLIYHKFSVSHSAQIITNRMYQQYINLSIYLSNQLIILRFHLSVQLKSLALYFLSISSVLLGSPPDDRFAGSCYSRWPICLLILQSFSAYCNIHCNNIAKNISFLNNLKYQYIKVHYLKVNLFNSQKTTLVSCAVISVSPLSEEKQWY